jgi:uncharacterized protein YggL (DUF469 family)
MNAPCPRYGFIFRCRLAQPLSQERSDALRDDFIEVIESHGLSANGGGDERWEYVIAGDGGQATESDRLAVLAWATSRAELAEVAAGPLVDLHEVA